MTARAFQDDLEKNYCWGCGSTNEHGLKIKSYWSGDEAICTWHPQPYHAAGPRQVLNGGIIATVIDCHSICTAVAAAYRALGQPIGTQPLIWYATGSLHVTYLRPAPLDRPIELRARVKEMKERKTLVTCSVFAGGEKCATGEVVAIRVPPAWLEGPT